MNSLDVERVSAAHAHGGGGIGRERLYAIAYIPQPRISSIEESVRRRTQHRLRARQEATMSVQQRLVQLERTQTGDGGAGVVLSLIHI